MFSGIVTDIFHIHGKGTVVAIKDLDGLPAVGDSFELAGRRCRIAATDKVRTTACLTGKPLTESGETMFLVEDCGLPLEDAATVHGVRISTVADAASGPSIRVWRGDITTLAVDAIVNAANSSLRGGGGVDGAIHRAAGPDLLAECRTLGGCPVGQARITGGYRLPATHVIHAVGPSWQGGGRGEDDLLASAYRSSLALAQDHGLTSIAFPAISTGIFGFPAERAARIAVDTIRRHGAGLDVTLVAFDDDSRARLESALSATSSADARGGAAEPKR